MEAVQCVFAFSSSRHLSAFRVFTVLISMLIIIMEICKAPTLRLKAVNMHCTTHIMYIEMENVISNENVYKKKKKANT